MEPQKPGNSPGFGPKVEKRQSRQSELRRVCSWIVQNETKGVLGQVSAGAARTIIDSARSREIGV